MSDFSLSRWNTKNFTFQLNCFLVFQKVVSILIISCKLQKKERWSNQFEWGRSISALKCFLVFATTCNQRKQCFLFWFVQKIQGRDWRLPKTIEYKLACRFELFQFPPVADWNFSFTHAHMELRHAVTTHQEHGNLCITMTITFSSCN